MVAVSMAGDAVTRTLVAETHRLVLPSGDAHRARRRAAAIIAALLLHVWLVAILLIEPSEDERRVPPSIQVELVAAPPPQPMARSQAPMAPEAAAPLTPPQTEARVSGGKLEREAGRPPDAQAPPSLEAAPEPAQPKDAAEPPPGAAPAAPLPATPPMPAAEGSDAIAPPPPEAKPTPQREPSVARAAAAPLLHPPARSENDSVVLGKGGGDPYLNTLRDEILRNRVYPPAARSAGLSGTAQYAMLLDRQGRLIRVRLLRSSGADILDKAGIEMIERSAPFHPLPPEIIGEVYDLVVILHFP